MNSKLVFKIVSFFLLVFLFACNKSDEWKGEAYVFVEYEAKAYQLDISGVFCVPPPAYSISVCYRFDKVSGEISSACNAIEMDENTEFVVGTTHYIGEPYGGGLMEVSEFPADLTYLNVLAITEEGTVNLQFRDSVFALGIDDEFYFKDTEIHVTFVGEGDNYDGLSVGDTLCVQERGMSYRIKNWGLLEKGDFKTVKELEFY